jgi:hypothetical protein
MPSIEIVCIRQSKPIDCSNYPFAVDASPELVSHRAPAPRFQSDFDGVAGMIYHLGNPDLKVRERGFYVAYELLSESSRSAEPPSALEFDPECVSAVFDLIAVLIRESPQSEVLFTSDWQFGPDHTLRLGRVSLAELRELHDSRALLLNALYTVHAG